MYIAVNFQPLTSKWQPFHHILNNGSLVYQPVRCTIDYSRPPPPTIFVLPPQFLLTSPPYTQNHLTLPTPLHYFNITNQHCQSTTATTQQQQSWQINGRAYANSSRTWRPWMRSDRRQRTQARRLIAPRVTRKATQASRWMIFQSKLSNTIDTKLSLEICSLDALCAWASLWSTSISITSCDAGL
jgi:hypothetical protein